MEANKQYKHRLGISGTIYTCEYISPLGMFAILSWEDDGIKTETSVHKNSFKDYNLYIPPREGTVYTIVYSDAFNDIHVKSFLNYNRYIGSADEIKQSTDRKIIETIQTPWVEKVGR